MVDLTKYWVMAQVISKIFVSVDGSTVAEFHQYRPAVGPNGIPAITLKETDSSGNWTDTWYLGVDPTMGVVEFRDTFPNGNNFVYASGGYIRWGTAKANIGDVLSYQAHIDCTQSVGIPCGSASGWGWNIATLTAVLNEMTVPAGTYQNVAQIDWQQYWCADATCSQQTKVFGTYYMAEGAGMIRMDWNGSPGAVLNSITITEN